MYTINPNNVINNNIENDVIFFLTKILFILNGDWLVDLLINYYFRLNILLIYLNKKMHKINPAN